jgi:hypothetical protein
MDIPLLTARDIECRIQSVSQNKRGEVGAVLLIYKDARVDMRILDQVFGAGNWQRTHEVINGNLFCNIDIWDAEKQTWVRKQDVGVESNTEKEKGQASDAFKRAGFNIGIGRELYTAPFIYITLNDDEVVIDSNTKKPKCLPSTRFEVAHIAYNDNREISELEIVDRHGNVRFAYGKPKYQQPKETKTAPKCVKCGFLFQPFTDKNGVEHTAKEAMEMAKKARGGVALCKACYDSK